MKSIETNQLVLPLLIYRGREFFLPSQKTTILVGKKKSKLAISCSSNDYEGKIAVCFTDKKFSEDLLIDDIIPVGLLAKIESQSLLDDGFISVELSFEERLKIDEIIDTKETNTAEVYYQTVFTRRLDYTDTPEKSQLTMFNESLKQKINGNDKYRGLITEFETLDVSKLDLATYCYKIATIFKFNEKISKKILITNSVIEKMNFVLESFDGEQNFVNENIQEYKKTSKNATNSTGRVWLDIIKLSDLTTSFGVIIGFLTLIIGVIYSTNFESFIYFIVSLVIGSIILFVAYIVSVLLLGYAQIVRNSEEQIYKRNKSN